MSFKNWLKEYNNNNFLKEGDLIWARANDRDKWRAVRVVQVWNRPYDSKNPCDRRTENVKWSCFGNGKYYIETTYSASKINWFGQEHFRKY